MSPYDSHTTTSPVVRPTPRRTATTSVLSTSTSSSTIEPFPVLTRSQHSRLDRIISALDENAKTWAEFKDKKEELEGDTTADEFDRTGQEDDTEDDDIFPISLKLVFQEGTTWKEKWRGVQSRRGGTIFPSTNTSSGRNNLDMLRAKMDRVSLTSPEGERSSRTRRAPSAEPRNPLVQTPALAPPPPRPRSTPATLPQQTPQQSTHPLPSTMKTRDFLVLKTKKEAGHSSSSDDYAGVPSLQDLALARRRRKEQEREEEGAQDSTTPPRTALQTQPITRTSREDQIRPSPPPPVHSTPPPPVHSTPPPPSKHPLLERRLAELGLAPTSSPPFHQPTFTVSNPSAPALPFSPSPRQSHIAHPSTSSAPDIPALESRATHFRELHLVSTHFDAWRSIVRFQQDRSFSVDHARETWLVRCVFQDWLGVTRKLRGLRETEIEWNARESQRRERADKARKKGIWRRWREKVAVKMEERREAEVREQKEVREMELRNARSEVVKRRNEGLIRRSIKTWRLATLESLAFKFRLRYLPLHPLRRWRQALTIKTSHVEMLDSVAEEVWVGLEQKRLGRVFSDWRKKMRLKIAKDEVEGRLEEGIKRGVLSVWVDKTRSALHRRQLENLAAESDARRIASSAVRTWSSRHSQVVALSESADDLAATFSVRLAQRSIKTWSLSTDAARFHQSRTDSIAKEFLSKWVEKLDHLQIDLEGKALEIIKEKNTQLLTVSFGEWKTSNWHRQRLLQAAEGVSRAKSLTRSIRGWREKLRGNELQVRKGEVVREFFVQRSAWRKWVDRVEKKKRERWVEGRIRLRKKEALAFWIARTRQAKDDKVLVAIVQEKSRKRIFQERLATWKDQVIVRKELERESTILYESRLAESALKRWVNVTVSVGNQLARADEFRAIKAEELRDGTFHKWLSSTRRSITLRERLASCLDKRRKSTLENAFGGWREKRLRGFEQQIRTKVERQTRRAVLEKWQGETTTLTALQVYRRNLLSRTLSNWKRWTPSTELVSRAIHHDSSILTRCTVQRWSLKTSYRKAFRNTSGRLSAPRSIPSPTSRTSPSSSFHLRASSPSSPTIRDRPSLHTSAFDSRSSCPDSPLLSPSRNLSDSTPATTAPSLAPAAPFLRRKNSSSASSQARSGHRPRLSAEYIAPVRPFHRRRSSIASLGARSAPAPLESETEDGESDTGNNARVAARSEGAGERKDVRTGYEALRERLRAAASNRQSR